jgi:hypothetical protein
MAGQGGGGWGVIIGIAALLGLVYVATGKGEDNSTSIPDELEKPIDDTITALNARFGHQWVNASLGLVDAYLRRVLPPQLVTLANIIIQVERMSKQAQLSGQLKMSGEAKRREVIRRMRGR